MSTSHGSETERVALVVGNASYENVSNLANPTNDAEKIALALERLGFKVIVGINLNQAGFIEKIKEFSRAMRGAKIALFYYAGHGLQVRGQNYLAPVDTRLNDEADLEFGTVRLQAIISQMEREQRTSIILLDACRDNPLTRNLASSMGTRSAAIGKGLAPVETGIGTLIAYSTQPGNVAYDGTDVHSPFTGALLRYLETPGEDIAVILRRVRRDVLRETKGVQVPWSNSSLTGPVILSVPDPSTKPAVDTIELTYWESIRDSANLEYFKSYLNRYPEGNFSDIARLKVSEWEQGTPNTSQSGEPASSSKKAPDAGEFSGAEAATELFKLERETAETTRRDKLASLDVALLNPAENLESLKELSGSALARSIQAELNRVGCKVGTADGVWGKNSRNGLRRFSIYAKAGLQELEPDPKVLEMLKDKSFRVCPLDCPAGYVETANKCYKKTAPRTAKSKSHKTRYGKCVADHRWYTSYLKECE
ncbi:caspase domain-containing protein [Roseibium sp. SCPC15]|uniref:caspase domain-containing protein n=1 Tax=Roseibium sp. SCP15 TaxID=3141376 RepID=UPI00333B784C